MTGLPALAVAALETALNRMMALDPGLAPRIAGLEGKVVGVGVTGTGISLSLYPGPWGVYVRDGIDPGSDTVIHGTPLGLMRLASPQTSTQELFSGDVRIEGDVRLGTRLRQLLARAEIDWEEQLSRLLGDIAAHQIGRGLRGLGRWRRRSGQALASDIGEYLSEESRLVPSRPEVEDFMAGVDTLRDDLERLTARVQRLRERRSPPGDS
jgi:ubiquinone biosynthesis protein UbiJ